MTSRLNTQLVLPGLSPASEPATLSRQAPGDQAQLASGTTTRGTELVRQEHSAFDRVAEPVASRLRDGPGPNSLIDATEVARFLGCTRGWVYEHKAELGVVRLGKGPRPRLRFDLGRLREIASAPAAGEAGTTPRRTTRQRGKRRSAALLQIRGQAP